MKKLIMLAIVLIQIAAASASEQFYMIDLITNALDYSVGIEMISISNEYEDLFPSEVCVDDDVADYEVKLKSSDDLILHELCFQPDYLYLFDPSELVEETGTTLYIPYSEEASLLEIYHNDNLIYSFSLLENLCNNNNICENPYSGYEGIFESHLSCSDCDYFATDGICNTAPGAEYSFNDHYCDFDCDLDADETDAEAGECYKENCNDNIMNQDESGIDCGGVCGTDCPSILDILNDFIDGKITVELVFDWLGVIY